MRSRLLFASLVFLLGSSAFAAPPSLQEAVKLVLDGNPEGAISLLRKLAADQKQPLSVRETALENAIAYGLTQAEKFDGSERLAYLKPFKDDFRALLALRPNDGALYYRYGHFLSQELRDSTLAFDAFQKALYLGDRKASIRLGGLYFNRREYEDAASMLQIATELSPSNYLLWFELGRSQFLLNDFEAAVASLEKAYHLANFNFVDYERLFTVYTQALLKVGRHQEAIEVAKRYMKFYNNAEGYLFVASVYSEAKQPDNAIFFYERARDDARNKQENQPRLFATVLNNYAWFLCTTQDPKYQTTETLLEAFEMATSAVKLSKRLHTYLDTLAEVYYLLGYPEQAIELEREAAEKDPSNPFYQEQLIKYEAAVEARPSRLVDPEVLQPQAGTLRPEKAPNGSTLNPKRPQPTPWP